MSLRLRHLRLRAETGKGRFGADIPFSNGLVILRADNSRGKSTAIQSILFALGLERMITARADHALTAAMRDRLIFDPKTMDETPVLESSVSLEIEGARGEIATVTRWVTHSTIEPGLVQVRQHRTATRPSESAGDYYVGRAGAASNPRGFHRWLAEFIGWDLPMLPARDGRTAPLYMEQVFPLLFVEQRRGWGGIQAQMPYFSGVTDVKRRAVEFLLRLDVGTLETERQRLKAEEDRLQQAWRSQVTALREGISGQGLVVVGLPEGLSLGWPNDTPPFLAESDGKTWQAIDELLPKLRNQLQQLEGKAVPRVTDVADKSESDLADAVASGDTLAQATSELRERLAREREGLTALTGVLESLRDDLREHQDILTLHRLGAAALERVHGDCPVCHQQLPDTLLESGSQPATLSPEDTIRFIQQQVQLFETMERDGQLALQAIEEQLAAVLLRAQENRARVRALETTLTAPENSPSVEHIASVIRLQDRTTRLEQLDERLLGSIGEFEMLSERGRDVRAALKDLPNDSLSEADRAKLSALELSFTEQLGSYDFGSFSDEQLKISDEDYLPRRAEFDLQADISASDSIRVVWAYLLALLEVSMDLSTNHPGLLVLDEPRQQSTKDVSFAALLRRASLEPDDRQIIFATSEPISSLEEMLGGSPHTLFAVEGYLLKAVQD